MNRFSTSHYVHTHTNTWRQTVLFPFTGDVWSFLCGCNNNSKKLCKAVKHKSFVPVEAAYCVLLELLLAMILVPGTSTGQGSQPPGTSPLQSYHRRRGRGHSTCLGLAGTDMQPTLGHPPDAAMTNAGQYSATSNTRLLIL